VKRQILISLTRILTLLAFSFGATAEQPLPQVERLTSSPVLRNLKPNPVSGAPSTDAEKTLAAMYVPEGFKVELIAAEPDIQQPVAFAWDERGRIWVVEAYSYPAKRPEGQGLDKVIIFSDEDGDGAFETRKVFTEGLNLASAIEVGYGGVWIGAAPQLLFIPDRNHDDVPDGPPEVLLDGFGYQDTHETMNSFLWGPDGWLYGIQGVFNTARIGKPSVPPEQRPEVRAAVWRFHPIRREFEVFANGGSNPWGLDYDEHGELFMTHCRSYWGKGFATHVIQGGHFWNQVNGNYAPFVIANPPPGFPEFRNYLLASARYGHGAGGAGPRGSDAIYGGHSHVGTMIYLGDNWPDAYRGHLFTHNLGGHQINHEINQSDGSGYETVSAGQDMLFCSDPNYVAVDLQCGPDGAVYMTDWVDPQHCHNPNIERWDRSNGRIYRMEWEATYKPAKVDLAKMSDVELVEQLKRKNQWYARTARRLLHERAQRPSGVAKEATDKLAEMLAKDRDPLLRLSALWAYHLANGLNENRLNGPLNDRDPYVRGWTVQLAAENGPINQRLKAKFVAMAKHDASPVVLRYLASAVQRMPEALAWPVVEALAQRPQIKDDRNLPDLLWDGLAPLMSGEGHPPLGAAYNALADPSGEPRGGVSNQTAPPALPDIDRAFALAQSTRIAQVADWIYWYAATLEGDPLNRVIATLKDLNGVALRKRLAGLWLALEPRANVPRPAAWNSVAPALYHNGDAQVQREAERLAAAFGDATAFPRLRDTLASAKADRAARRHAFAVLSRAQDRESLPVFLKLLDDDAFRTAAIRLLARFDAPEISRALIERFMNLKPADRVAALDALTSRASFAVALLDAVAAKQIPRDQLTAFQSRQLSRLKSPAVDQRVTATWGRIHQTPAEKQAQIASLEKTFNEAPLWAFNARAGRDHFEKLCSQCHRVGDLGQRVGPELTGAGKHGVRYFLENVVDPNAVIGTDFRATTVETKDGESVSGLLANETTSAITLRTTAGDVVIAKADIQERVLSEKSLMPEGLLDPLTDRERIELLKFLTSN
jgi:putative membrane-bound dehydrogenase-like protein